MEPITILYAVLFLLIAWLVYKKLFSKGTDYTDIKSVMAEVEVYIAYGLTKYALNLLEKALEYNPDNSELINKLNEVKSKNI